MPKKKETLQEKAALRKKMREELAFKLKREKLEREVDNTKAQISEIRRKVFEQAQLINLPIIKEECLHKWGFFERTVDWKDFYISQLRDDLYYYEVHHRHMEQIHNENVNKLLEIYKDAIDNVMNVYQIEREKLIKERYRQENRIVLTQNRRVENMETIHLVLLEQRKKEFDKLDWDNTNERQLKIFRYQDAVARIAQEGDEEIRDLWTVMRTVFDKYKSSTFRKRQDYLMMKQKDLTDKENLDKLNKRMTQLHRYIKQLRSKLGKLKIDEGLRLELEMRRNTQDRLKQLMRQFTESSIKQLEGLSLVGTAVIEKLKEFCNKATETLSLVSICKKLETQEERVAPHLTATPPLGVFSNNQILPLFDDMEQMWAKILHVARMKEFMASQSALLKEENCELSKRLRTVLASYNTRC